MAPEIAEPMDVDVDSSDIEILSWRRSMRRTEHTQLQGTLRQATSKEPVVVNLISSDEESEPQPRAASFITRPRRTSGFGHDTLEPSASRSSAGHHAILLNQRVSSSPRAEPYKRPRSPGASAKSGIVISSDSDSDIPARKRSRLGSSNITSRSATLVPSLQSMTDDDDHAVEEVLTRHDGISDEAPTPRSKYDNNESSDSEHEYEQYHSALSLADNANWQPLKKISRISVAEKSAGDLSIRLAALSVSESAARMSKENAKRHRTINYGGGRTVDFLTRADPATARPGKMFLWDELPISLDFGRSNDFHCYNSLQAASTISRAPGSINNIIQNNGTIVMSSAVLGGGFNDAFGQDETEDTRNRPYNRDGTLVVWREGKEYVLQAHQRRVQSVMSDTDVLSQFQYYTVNDVQWNPAFPERFVSSGADGTVQSWDCTTVREGATPKRVSRVKYEGCEPQSLQFKPGESLLAIEASDGYVYLQKDAPNSARRPTGLSLAPDIGHCTAHMVWGTGLSSDYLFASSHASDESDCTGYHKAFDWRRAISVVDFDAQEAGQKMAIAESGDILAIATEAANDTHYLKLYDVRRLMKRVAQKVELDPYESEEGARFEVNSLAFSPDGIYLAVARNDNTVQVYDSRFLNHGVLYSFAHQGAAAVSRESFGVVKASWVSGTPRGVGLVTGGTDGCVRLWDTRQAAEDPSNGRALASCADDIAYFLLGDTGSRDYALIVGECSGTVTVFSRTGPNWPED